MVSDFANKVTKSDSKRQKILQDLQAHLSFHLGRNPILQTFKQTCFLCSFSLNIHNDTWRISTGERPFIDILQDRRYWVIHLITIPSLFLAGVIFILSGFVYKLFGVANFMRYFYNVPINTQISLINDRFSIFLFIEDV